MQPGVDIEARADRLEDRRPPVAGQAPAGRGDADEQPVRADRALQRLVEGRDERHVERRHDLAQVAAGHRAVEDGQDLVVAVADDAQRGLGVVDGEEALGQDDQASGVGGDHLLSLGETRTPPGRGPGALRDWRSISAAGSR